MTMQIVVGGEVGDVLVAEGEEGARLPLDRDSVPFDEHGGRIRRSPPTPRGWSQVIPLSTTGLR